MNMLVRFQRLLLCVSAITICSLCTAPALVQATSLPRQQPALYALARNATITPSLNTTAQANAIHRACVITGTDEQALVDVLGPMPPPDRLSVAMRYQELYKTSLRKTLSSETSGPFQDLLEMISVPLPEMESNLAVQSKVPMYTRQTGKKYNNRGQFIPLLIGRSDDDLAVLRETYRTLEGTEMAKAIKTALGSDLRLVVLPLLNGERATFDPSIHTAQRVQDDTRALYKAGAGRLGTDESKFVALCVKSPLEHLVNISTRYEATYKKSLVQVINSEFSGVLRNALLFYVRLLLEDPMFVLAEYFESTMAGIGTDELALNAAIVRYYDLLPEISAAYQTRYGKSLGDRIASETNRYHRKLILQIYASAVPYTIPAASDWWPTIEPWVLGGLAVAALLVLLNFAKNFVVDLVSRAQDRIAWLREYMGAFWRRRRTAGNDCYQSHLRRVSVSPA